MTSADCHRIVDGLPCGRRRDELELCLAWIDDHGAPCEWSAIVEADYVKAIAALSEVAA